MTVKNNAVILKAWHLARICEGYCYVLGQYIYYLFLKEIINKLYKKIVSKIIYDLRMILY